MVEQFTFSCVKPVNVFFGFKKTMSYKKILP